MGRKTRRPVVTKRRPSIPRVFNCPRCEAQAIKIKMDGAEFERFAIIDCGRCHINMTVTGIKSWSEPVDVYGDFIDQYYASLEGLDEIPSFEPKITPLIDEIEKSKVQKETVAESLVSAEPEQEIKEKPKQTAGFVPISKADALMTKKQMAPSQKSSKSTKKISLSDLNKGGK